jgi:hypothetical protein
MLRKIHGTTTIEGKGIEKYLNSNSGIGIGIGIESQNWI